MAGSMNWRSAQVIQEENRYGSEINLSRATEVITHLCTKCGGEIAEVRFADGHRSFDCFGVTTTLTPTGSSVAHHRCPDPVREEDLRHDAGIDRPQE